MIDEHRLLSQVVADVFGIAPTDVRVNTELDTAKDAWSIASGNYASRFAPAVAGTVKLAAERLATLGFDPIGSTPNEFAARIKSELATWSKVIRAAGIKPM